MKAIDNAVYVLRRNGHTITASLLEARKGCLSFLGLVLVAFLYRSDQSLIVSLGKLGIALIGFASWFTDAYFVRRRWQREIREIQIRAAIRDAKA